MLWENIVGTLLKDKAVSKSYEIGPNKVWEHWHDAYAPHGSAHVADARFLCIVMMLQRGGSTLVSSWHGTIHALMAVQKFAADALAVQVIAGIVKRIDKAHSIVNISA